MGAGGCQSVTDLDEDAVALVIVFAVIVQLLQQSLRVADLTSNATARHCLEVGARAERFSAELLHTGNNGSSQVSGTLFRCEGEV